VSTRPGGAATNRPGWYDQPPPAPARPGAAPQARRAPDPRGPVRWDDDLSDPSELAGWRSSQAQVPPAPAAPPWGPATPGRTPPRPRPGEPPRRIPGEPGGPGTQVLDRGWQGPPPAAPGRSDDPSGRLDRYDDDRHDRYDDSAPGERDAGERGGERRGPKPVASAPGPRPELPNVAAFDGLRAVALLAVLAFHQGFEVARGGFLGISSFFTLSGFLVATLALAEWSRNGRLAIPRFWDHRARRIVPALVFTIALVVVLQATLRVGSGPGFRGDVLAALGQFLNWRFAVDGDGFASVLTDPSPVQHLWSVSLLAQITVIFPLAFVGLMRVTGRHWRTAGAAFGLAAVASFVVASMTADRSGNDGMAYYGTHTRLGELLVGVVLAYAVLSPGVRRAAETPTGVKVVRYGAPVALVVLAWLWHSTSLYSTNLFGGVTALNAVLTAWVIFAVTMPSPAATALGSLPLRTLGKISYAAYLLHWPIFLLVDDERLGVDGPLLFLARLGATLGAAALLTFGLERPFRTRLRLRGRRLAVALGLSAVVVAAAAFALPEQPPAGVSLSVDDGNGAGDLDVVVPSDEGVATIALVGGSLAGTLPQGFETWNSDNPDEQVRVHTHVVADCPLSGPGPVRLAGETIGEDTACAGFAPRLPRLLDEAGADVVVVVPGVGDLGEREIDRQWQHVGDPVYDDWLRERLTDLADTLDGAGVPVVWATSPHVRLAPGGDLDGDWTDVADNDPARVDRLNDIIRAVAARHDDSTVIDLEAWAQRLPRGEFSPDHRVEGRDLSEVGADQAVAWMAPELFEILGIEGS
jgi:peptidoglycan/LPS O-acetylase OafA/YrhL